MIAPGVRFAGWVIVAAAVVGQFLVRPTPDVSWLLYVSRELLHGARLGVDLLEVTPPMIFLLKLPIVGVAEFLGVGLWEAWIISTSALIVGSLVLIRRLVPKLSDGERGREGAAMLTIAFLLLVLPGVDFGQKEHMTVVLILPFVMLASRRLSGEQVSPRLAVLVGVMGGIAIGIKPHFVLLLAGLVALEARRLGRRLPWLEHLSVVLVGVLYLILVGVLAPGYYAYARDYGALYQGFLSGNAWQTLVLGDGTLPGLIALGVFAVLRRYLPQSKKSLGDVLAVATAAFYVAAVIQGKGWWYQFLPSIVFASLLLALLLTAKARGLLRLHRWYHGIGTAALAATLVSPLPGSAWRLLASSTSNDADPDFGTLISTVREAGDGATVAVLSSNIASGFPLIFASGARWPLRFPSLWPLIALYTDSFNWEQVIVPRTPDRWEPLERSFVDGVIEDLEAGSPTLVIVRRPDANTVGWGGASHFDYLEYFEQDPRFSRFFRGYDLAGPAGSYDVYRRRTPGQPSLGTAPPSLQAASPGWVTRRLLVLTLLGVWGSMGFFLSWRISGARAGPLQPPGQTAV